MPKVRGTMPDYQKSSSQCSGEESASEKAIANGVKKNAREKLMPMVRAGMHLGSTSS